MSAYRPTGTIRYLTGALVTGLGVHTLEIVLPDGPGFYELRRFIENRTAGAAAATKTTSLSATATATAFTALVEGAAAAPVATATTFRSDSIGRTFYTGDGKVLLTVVPDVDGDTFSAQLVLVKVGNEAPA